MKPLSLSVLLLLSTLAATAEVVMVTGTVYDVGKGNHSQDATVDYTADKSQCWAATSANLFQHWQDAYADQLNLDGIPDGYTDTEYTKPSGTRYLQIFDVLSRNFEDVAGNLKMAVDWYFKGSSDVVSLKPGHEAGAFVPVSNMNATTVSYGNRYSNFKNLTELKNKLRGVFNGGAGQGVFLSITTPTGAHAITCWGYETNADDALVALYITDSDDMKFGAQRLEIRQEDGVLKLYSPYNNVSYHGTGYNLTSFSYFDSFTYWDDKPSNALTALPADGKINTAADMTGAQLSSFRGVTVGQGAILAASGSDATSLILAGGGAEAGDGFSVEAGSMVVLSGADVSVSGFAGNGISAGADVYLDGGTVSIQNNEGTGLAVQGTDVDPKAYARLSGNDSVEVSGNMKSGILVAGGALADKSVEGNFYPSNGQLDITGNGGVSVTGNRAENGGGANVMGRLNAQDNGTVVFDNNTATGNGGALSVCGGNNGVTMAKGNAVISGNTSVTFSNNTAEQGGAIYAINLTVENNGKVDIKGNTAAKGAAIYAGSEAIPASQAGYYYTATAQVAIKNNTEVNISGNTATDTDIIFFQGGKFSISGNKSVTLSGNTVNSATGSVVHNADPYFKIAGSANYMYADGREMEIAHNDKVVFSGNTAKYDILNESTLYLSADKGQSITFQHGFKNSASATRPFAVDGGTTYLGKDAAGNTSEGGKYVFADNGGAVTLETAVATVKADGGMVYDGSTLEISKTEFSSTDIKFTLEASSLKLSDVTFASEAVMTVDFGYFADKNTITMDAATRNGASSVGLALLIDLVDAKTTQKTAAVPTPAISTGLETQVFSGRQNGTVIYLSDYLGENVDLSNFTLSLLVDGWTGEGSELAIDTCGYTITEAVVWADAYVYDRTEGNILYYYGKPQELIPEPATATLSLLALAALCARRRRKCA